MDALKPFLPEIMGEDRALISGVLWVFTTRGRWQSLPALETFGYHQQDSVGPFGGSVYFRDRFTPFLSSAYGYP